jgi:predicted flavoprotein YhiN
VDAQALSGTAYGTAGFLREMQGLRCDNVSVRLQDVKRKTVYKDFGEMLFTHYGLSGPIILSAARIWRAENIGYSWT